MDEFGTEIKHAVEKSEKVKKSQKFLSYRDLVCQLPSQLEIGDYIVHFSADLPERIPSSLHFKD